MKEYWIDQLNLVTHEEGGYFTEVYSKEYINDLDNQQTVSNLASTIFYFLTSEKPLGAFHLNKSNLFHFFHSGDPVTYYLIYPNGDFRTEVLGPGIQKDEKLQLLVPGGVWKASYLHSGEYALISEVVIPAFDPADRLIGTKQILFHLFPQLKDDIIPYIQS